MPFGRKSAPREYDEASLLEASLRLLESKMRSSAELRRALKRKVGAQPEGPALIEATIAKLRAMRLLDDERYAAAYTSYRKTNERFGRQRVRQDLMVKGVDKTTIDKTMAEKGMSFDLKNLKPEDLEDIVESLREMEINVDSKDGDNVRVYAA